MSIAVLVPRALAQRQGSSLNVPNQYDPFYDSRRLVGRDRLYSEIDSNEIAVPLDSIKPQYPVNALVKRISGWVWLKIKLNPDGVPQQTQIVECFPEWQDFESAAEKAVKQARFHPPPNTGARKHSKWMHYVVYFDPYANPNLGDTLPAVDSVVAFDTPAAATEPIIVRMRDTDHQVFVVDTGLIKVLADRNGIPRDYRIVVSSGKPIIDSASVHFVKVQQFAPAMYQGSPVSTWVEVPFEFARTEHFLALPWLSAVAVPQNLQLADNKSASLLELELEFDKERGMVPSKLFNSCPDSVFFGLAAAASRKMRFAAPSGFTLGDSLKITHRSLLVQTSLLEIAIDSLPCLFDKQPTGDRYVSPVLTYSDSLSYSEIARKNRIEGSVEVAVLVDTEGAVRIATLWKESSLPSMDRIAVEGAIANRYTPATLDGKPLAVWVTYKVEFKLE